MIPMRYEGGMHASGLMFREEGLRGLYRGYTAYIMATAIYWMVVPLVAELAIQRQPLAGNNVDKTGQLIDEVHTLKKLTTEKRKED